MGSDLEEIIREHFGSRESLAVSLWDGEVGADDVVAAIEAAFDKGHERGLGY